MCLLNHSSRYYSYWNLFRCKPIRDVPSSLSLYNYKLSGVKDGTFSFGKPSDDVAEIDLSDLDKMLSVTISGTALEDESKNDQMPKKVAPARLLEIEVVRPFDDDDEGIEFVIDPDLAVPAAANGMVDDGEVQIENSLPCKNKIANLSGNAVDGACIGAGNAADNSASSVVQLQAQLLDAYGMIAKLEEEKLRMAEEVIRMKQELLRLSVLSQDSDVAVSAVAAAILNVSDRQPSRRLSEDDPDPFLMVLIFNLPSCFLPSYT